MLLAIVGVLVIAAGATTFVLVRQGDDDPYAAYCSEVEKQRAALGDELSGGPQTGLIAALPTFQALAEKAPQDIEDDWKIVIDHIQDLQKALDAAGVDASTYDRDHLPEGVTEDQRGAIDAAATALGSPIMQAALGAVQQEARDVCGTPLSL
ncbi:hypothetical protein GCM10022242_35730 [Nocardioides panacisoli]|uniref:Uncharacterized protein n=1 Tax=Nocardioides panacisoli TaxID=627624 RepID=A0ABP7J092_9ACTN